MGLDYQNEQAPRRQEVSASRTRAHVAQENYRNYRNWIF
jgi:hypothetical protein